MRWLSLLSRVAFICNVLFVAAAALRYKNFINNEAIASMLIISGYFLGAFVFNPIVNILYAIALGSKKKLVSFAPKWLAITNFIFLMLQLVYFLYLLND